VGLRERKKEKTRLAILDAALDLFLEQGYGSTTVEQIAGAAEVSPRTFFRYFTSKDHLALWFHDHGEETMLETLRSRPTGEPVFTSLTHALRAVVRDVEESTAEDTARFLKLRRLMDDHPHLMGLSVARGTETERRLATEIAVRRGTDPDNDRFCHLIVAFAMASMRIGFECPRRDAEDVRVLAGRLEETIALAQSMLRPDLGGPPPPA
jgi:AcrR family transcriptional regulator